MAIHQSTPDQTPFPMIQFDDDDEEDVIPSTWQTFSRKFKEQPLVPIGAGATTIALVGAARAIQRGESSTFNRWCRYRIVFQAMTLVAALGGSMIYNHNNQKQIQDQKTQAEARELERVRQRDLRIQAQELSMQSSTKPLPPVTQNDPDTNSLFLNQNLAIRKTLQDRKISDQQNKSLHHPSPDSIPKPDDQKMVK